MDSNNQNYYNVLSATPVENVSDMTSNCSSPSKVTMARPPTAKPVRDPKKLVAVPLLPQYRQAAAAGKQSDQVPSAVGQKNSRLNAEVPIFHPQPTPRKSEIALENEPTKLSVDCVDRVTVRIITDLYGMFNFPAISKQLLCASSARAELHFRLQTNDSVVEPHAEPRVFELKAWSPAPVHVYFHWLHTRAPVAEQDGGRVERVKGEDLAYVRLVDLYGLGLCMDDREFRDAVINAMLRRAARTDILPGLAALNNAYYGYQQEWTSRGTQVLVHRPYARNTLQYALEDMFARDEMAMNQIRRSTIASGPIQFRNGVLERMKELKRRQIRGWEVGMLRCEFHEHLSGQDCPTANHQGKVETTQEVVKRQDSFVRERREL